MVPQRSNQTGLVTTVILVTVMVDMLMMVMAVEMVRVLLEMVRVLLEMVLYRLLPAPALLLCQLL